MFNQKSNKTLWIILAILIIAVVLIFSTESTKNERTFKKDLVEIDTSSVNEILLYPKSQQGKEVKLTKDGDSWKVFASSGKSYSVPITKVKNILNQLLTIKPKRVATRNEERWGNYEIDSASTRVVIKENGDETLDLLIGKFSFKQPRSMSTFVKLNNDSDVYEVDGFLEMSFNKDANSFRDETIVKSDISKWNKISIQSDTLAHSFELVKMNENWYVDGVKTDSAKTETKLQNLARVSNNNFIDIEKSNLPLQTAKVIIEVENEEPIVITGYGDSARFIIESSQNPENYFEGNSSRDKLLFKKESLFL